MAGSAVARQVSTAARKGVALGETRPLVYRIAGRADESRLRQLLRENAFGGDIRLSFECEPDALAAARIYGPVHQTLVAIKPGTEHVLAMALRSERDVFVNGQVQRLGYLGQLRVDAVARRRPRLLAGGFDFCRALHRAGRVPAYLVSIVSDNLAALRLLSSGRLQGAPVLTPLEPLVTWAIPTHQGRFASASRGRAGTTQRASAGQADEIADLLQRSGARRQFTPVWSGGDLRSGAHTPGLAIEDFLVRLDGGQVTACAACWDQRAFRQTVVRGYSSRILRWRRVINSTARLTGIPHLPEIGTVLSFAFLSHLAVDGDDPERAAELLCAALRHARAAGLQYVMLGLAARHPLAPMITRRFRHRRYLSQLFLAHWPDGDEFVRALDSRIPQPEVAVL